MTQKFNPLFTYAYRKGLPKLWQDRIDVWRGESQVFRPCFQETRSIFIHIPKAAGTSIARAIYGMNVGHRKASDYIAVSRTEFYKYYRFSFVRNPWDRAVSAYNFAKQGGTNLVQPLPNPVYQTAVFSSFDRFVKEWLPNADLSKEDVVFASQHEYIYDKNGKLLVDYVGKIEELEKGIQVLEKTLKRQIQIKNLNSSNRDNSDYRTNYTQETAAIIEDIYRKDIELFNYSF